MTIVAASHDEADLRMVADAAGARVLAAIDWQSFSRSPPPESARLLLLSTLDTPEPVLAEVLPFIAGLAARDDLSVVVNMTEDQIDLVAGALFGPHVDLLCRPEPGTLAAAVALGLARRGSFLADTVREREAERLRRLNDEVARIADVLARLTTAADRKPGTIAERGPDYQAAPAPAAPAVSAGDIRRVIRARRLREAQFPGMLEDPAWDILLDLYAAELEGTQVSVSSLCIASAVPATTALRWISRMTEAGLLERQPDPFDRRRAFIALSEEGRERMRRYLAAISQNGLQIV